ncbi:MAG TPA: cellulase family glycosylhydrolase [Candidatus Dormibacteraeota bacterium]|nr:cellulase family glycosylhydrolase [Candidatus Dormibacteraeota bacterium]
MKASLMRFACAAILAIALVPAFALLMPGRTSPAVLHASAASIRGGINAEPSMRPWRYMGMNPDSWWCIPPNCYQNPNPATTINTELNLMRSLKVAVVRIEFPWYQMEPSQGHYDWSRSDMIVNAANAYGVQLQPIIVYTPPWAAAAPTNLPTPAQFGSFVGAIVGRYHGTVHYWEMWNEPNYGFNGGGYLWPAAVSDYVNDILNPGYAAAHAADPNAKVMFGGPSSPDLSWLGTVISTGNFDIAAFHDYGNPIGDSAGVEGVLQQYGKGNKPLWVGEYGTQENSINDVNQQSLMRNVLTSNSAVSMALWYNLRDDNSMTCCPAAVHSAAYWGLVQHDNVTLKAGFATMASLLGGTTPPPPPPPSPPATTPPAPPPTPTPIAAAPSPTPAAAHSPAPGKPSPGGTSSPTAGGGGTTTSPTGSAGSGVSGNSSTVVPTSNITRSGGIAQVVYMAVLLFGLVVFGFGIVVTTSVGAALTKMIPAGANAKVLQSIQANTWSVGIGIATVGGLLCLAAMLLLSLLPSR